jgi:uncharacterized membrane protein YoaK (UPF0700 family)
VSASIDLWGRLTRDERHGPLGGLMILLTAVTGMVDAVSILRLGHVFVANMTGNVVFIGFGAAGARGFPIYDSLVAIAAFLLGAFAGGQLERRWAGHRARALRIGAGAQAGGLLVATVVAAVVGDHPQPAFRYALLVLLAAGMGLQNAVVRRLAVPDLTTTVLTMTLTGLASDLRTTRARPGQVPLRALAVVTMFAGALIGGLLVVRAGEMWAPLALATVLATLVAAVAHHHSASQATWTAGG